MKRSRRSWAAVSGGGLMCAHIVYNSTLCQEVTKIPCRFGEAGWHACAPIVSPLRSIPVWSGRHGQKPSVQADRAAQEQVHGFHLVPTAPMVSHLLAAYQQPVAHIAGEVAVKALDRLGTSLSIGEDYRTSVFRRRFLLTQTGLWSRPSPLTKVERSLA